MVKGISKDEISQYCAMINIDSLGLGAPQVDDTVTAKKLMNLASRLAKEMKIPYAHAPIRFGTSDGASFQEKKIPSILIHGLTNEWRTVLHTGRDLPEIVNSTSVYLGYRLVLALLMSVDAGSCDSWK